MILIAMGNRATLCAVGLVLAMSTSLAFGQAKNEYRGLRDAVREGRIQSIEIRGRVVAVISEGRFKLNLTSADFVRVDMPDDYPVVVTASGWQATARVLTPEQARTRDEYARLTGAGTQESGEIRLIAEGVGQRGPETPIELNAWSGGQLYPLALSAGDEVTITARVPSRKGK